MDVLLGSALKKRKKEKGKKPFVPQCVNKTFLITLSASYVTVFFQ